MAAGAADPTPGPSSSPGSAVIQYAGTGVVTEEGGQNVYNYPVTWTVDCTGEPCTITGVLNDTDSNDSFPLTGGILQPFAGGTGTYSYGESGDICDGTWLGAYTITIVAAADQITAVFDVPGYGNADCANGTSVQYDGAHVDITSSVTSGDTCYIFETCPTAAPTGDPTAAAIPTSSGTGSSAAIVASTPSSFSTLATVLDSARPANVLWATALTVVLVILVALPTQLFNSAVEKGGDRLSAWWRARRREPVAVMQAAGKGAPRKPFAGWPLAAGGVLAASLISSFVDPDFGFNAASPRVFLSVLASFVLDAVVGWFLVIWLVRRTQKHAVPVFTFAPATLLIVVAAVVFSRVTGFQPGIVFGLVAGVGFGAVLASQKARVTLIGLAYGLAAAIIGWIGYSLFAASGNHSFFAVFAQETLSAMAIGGIAALPIALIPLRGLSGYEVFAWNRIAWGVAYAIGLFGFFFVLMPMPFSWTGVPLSLGTWLVLYLLYAILAVGTWLLIVKPWKRDKVELPAG